MGAGLSNALQRRRERYQVKRDRNATADDRAGPERQDGSSVKTEPIAPITDFIETDQDSEGSPSTGLPQATAPQVFEPVEIGNYVSTPLVGASTGGDILSKAQGVSFQGFTAITSIVNNNAAIQPDNSEKDSDLVKKILAWISDINYHAIQADNYRKRAAGTGKWAFEDPVISKWLKGAIHILWGVGMPGAGKTILSSIIIDHLTQRAKTNKRICVAFAFSRYTEPFTGEEVLSGLLRQVVQDHPCALQFVKRKYEDHLLHGTRMPQAEVLEVLTAIFNSDLFDEKFCALDGLDEALADTQVDILDTVSELPVNFLIMSRPLPLLKELVPEATLIDIKINDADIKQLIEEKLRRMATLRDLLKEEGMKEVVLRTVVEKSSGMFLVASLQLNMLGGSLHIKALRAALDALPVGVNDMYQATMDRIKTQEGADLALGALAWLVYARESLSMEMLRHALAVETKTFTYDSELLVNSNTLLSVCCGLITFEPQTNLVRLVHFTVREFLVTYLSKAGLTHRPCWLASFVEKFILECQRFPWVHPISHEFDFLNSIQVAAACNFHSLLARWLGSDPSPTNYAPPSNLDLNSRSAKGRTALTLAAVNGHLETAELLIGVEGVDI
ncbi:hypothetical protein FA15DRAFT_694854 [Coprinopsis marcescibilis]|uniref:Uncharacterized protein n=1 Tax=Coprinopsis marcescibilis TaxID=230819 RepID=A0A5C3L6F8_COPMA|nr:hypothetical protein FA15DRAFT_694854 [Coprinopsis marcescibilis]